MRNLLSLALVLLAVLNVLASLPQRARASSHREAPLIASDPQADNTDVYAFVSPDLPDTVTLIANYVPLEEPNGGPNFNFFGDDVLYEIKVVNDVQADREISFQFRFRTEHTNPNTYQYNTDMITSLDDPDWATRQFYNVRRIDSLAGNVVANTLLATDLPSPPVNIGPRSTPNYEALANAAIRDLPGGGNVFAGQRDEGFFVDLGSIFDVSGLRGVNPLHIYPQPYMPGLDGAGGNNVHSLVIQLPITALTRDGSRPTDRNDPRAVIGVYATASRQSIRVLGSDGSVQNRGRFVQVSRLANPLTNEVIIPRGRKDFWNSQNPLGDQQFEAFALAPEVTRNANRVYPILDDSPETNRADILAIFMTGLRTPTVNLNYTGETRADLLRLNMAIPPALIPNRLGVLGGDEQGFPNGRRPVDDVVDIELRAFVQGYGPIVQATYGFPDRLPNNTITDNLDTNDMLFLATFPYLATPHQGYEHLHHQPTTPGPQQYGTMRDE